MSGITILKHTVGLGALFLSSAWAADPLDSWDDVSHSPPPSSSTSGSGEAHWASRFYRQSIGFEGSGGVSSMIGQNAITYGVWNSRRIGFELFIAASKTSDGVSEVQTTTTNAITGAKTISTAYSGTSKPFVLTLGVMPKVKAYRNSWLMVYGAMVGAASYVGGVSNLTGTISSTASNPLRPNDQTITETSYGTVTSDSFLNFAVGPRVGSEIYVKSLPNVAIGFAAGIITTFSGDQTTTSDVRTASYLVVDGIKQTSTSEAGTKTVTRTRPGISGTTVAIAGQSFNLFGTFTIRYVW